MIFVCQLQAFSSVPSFTYSVTTERQFSPAFIPDKEQIRSLCQCSGSGNGVVEFSSSNKDVVVVSDDGALTTVSSGEAEITATYLTFSNTINIVVTDEHDPDPGHTNHHISFGDLDQTDSALVGSTIQLKAELYSDGVKDDTAEFTYLIDCDTTIATMSVVDGVATINVNRNRKNIGESFIITATCSQTETTHSKELIVKGWS